MTASPKDSAIFLNMEGGVEVCLPGTLGAMTTYVVLEQEKWFESEIAFMRRLLRPAMRAIDIGANYGLYTLTMAKQVGPEGRVWAFEPASDTCNYLRRSLAINGLANVELLQCALSDRTGRARLKLENKSELNRLSKDATGPGEDVAVDTLDRFAASLPPGNIDFVKIDAEGQERNIAIGGARFLERHDPLVMFERMHASAINAPMIEALQERGFELYRLVPGLDILAPFAEAEADRYQLNVFACRPGRAARLEAAGVLARSVASLPSAGATAWWGTFADRAFFAPFRHSLTPDAAIEPRYRALLNLYAAASSPAHAPGVRWAALRECLAGMSEIAAAAPSVPRLFTLARIAAEAGARNVAVKTLRRFSLDPAAYRVGMFDEPFLPAGARFDSIDPGPELGSWCAVSVFDHLERLRSFSSYFSDPDSLPHLEAFRHSRFFSPELERRRQLVRIGTGRQQRLEFQPILAEHRQGNLNAGFWRSLAA